MGQFAGVGQRLNSSAHGSLRATIVPHMGLATPLHTVYDWLDRIGYAALGPQRAETRTAGAER